MVSIEFGNGSMCGLSMLVSWLVFSYSSFKPKLQNICLSEIAMGEVSRVHPFVNIGYWVRRRELLNYYRPHDRFHSSILTC